MFSLVAHGVRVFVKGKPFTRRNVSGFLQHVWRIAHVLPFFFIPLVIA